MLCKENSGAGIGGRGSRYNSIFIPVPRTSSHVPIVLIIK